MAVEVLVYAADFAAVADAAVLVAASLRRPAAAQHQPRPGNEPRFRIRARGFLPLESSTPVFELVKDEQMTLVSLRMTFIACRSRRVSSWRKETDFEKPYQTR